MSASSPSTAAATSMTRSRQEPTTMTGPTPTRVTLAPRTTKPTPPNTNPRRDEHGDQQPQQPRPSSRGTQMRCQRSENTNTDDNATTTGCDDNHQHLQEAIQSAGDQRCHRPDADITRCPNDRRGIDRTIRRQVFANGLSLIFPLFPGVFFLFFYEQLQL